MSRKGRTVDEGCATGPEPLTIGRGTGYTAREARRAIDAYLKKKKVASGQWQPKHKKPKHD